MIFRKYFTFYYCTGLYLSLVEPFLDYSHVEPGISIVLKSLYVTPLSDVIRIINYVMQGGKVSFGYIYGIGACGVVALYLLLNIMSMVEVGLGCVASVIGYCILPMVFLSTSSIVLSLK